MEIINLSLCNRDINSYYNSFFIRIYNEIWLKQRAEMGCKYVMKREGSHRFSRNLWEKGIGHRKRGKGEHKAHGIGLD